ncbi:MAG TPA: MBL fold metallo-hydrolase, partial [Anaerolineales bacterium]
MQIIDNVHVVPKVRANCYVILDADGLTIIDAGLPRSQGRILNFIAGLGRSPRDVKRILITHSDWDHIGGLRALHRATAARTYASRIETEAMAAGRPSRPTKTPSNASLARRLMKALFKPRPFSVDEVVTDGQVLPVLGGLRV